MTGTVLILGATGRFGRHAAEAFWNAGWSVRTFDRNADDLMTAAAGADLIVNAWNPRYPDWAREVPALTARVIAAARASGATVLIPGNVYGYGAGAPDTIAADTPKRAANLLGRIRNEMENAFRASGVPTIILRAGDYIDTEASDNWFDMVVTGKLFRDRVTAPGDPDTMHAWAFLPDFARAAVMLAERRDTLATFQEVLFPGYALTIRDMGSLVSRATGRRVTVRPFAWWLVYLAAPFWPMGRHLIEMRYLWNMPHRLGGSAFAELLPEFRPTEPLAAITAALREVDVDPYEAVTGRGFDVAAE